MQYIYSVARMKGSAAHRFYLLAHILVGNYLGYCVNKFKISNHKSNAKYEHMRATTTKATYEQFLASGRNNYLMHCMWHAKAMNATTAVAMPITTMYTHAY